LPSWLPGYEDGYAPSWLCASSVRPRPLSAQPQRPQLGSPRGSWSAGELVVRPPAWRVQPTTNFFFHFSMGAVVRFFVQD